MFSRRLRALTAAGILGGLVATSSYADADLTASPRFDIREFQVEGNTLLPESQIHSLVTPYVGVSRDFGDVQRAIAALQTAYQQLGYNSVQVLLPEQEVVDGVVKINILQQHIGNINVEGNQFYESDNILQTAPALKSGEIPNMKVVQKSIAVANENPSKQTVVLFKNNPDDPATIDATLKVVDDKPWKGFVTLDNSGSRETGQGRLGFGYQNYNLFGRDHRLTLQYITNLHSPEEYFNPEHEVNVFGAAYTIPLYELGDSVDFIAGYSNVNTGTVAGGLITVSGKGVILGAHYNHNFAKQGNYDQRVVGGVEYHAYRSDIFIGGSGSGLTPHVTATPWSLTYIGKWQQEEEKFAFSVGGSWNVLSEAASHGDEAIYKGFPYLAEQDFSKYSFSVDAVHAFAKHWQLHLNLSGQFTDDHLIPGEQFRIGGMDSVRGWHESVISGDKGYRWTAEIITPDFGNQLGDKVGLRALAFIDGGYVDNNRGIDGTKAVDGSDKSIASIGAGLRYSYSKNIVARFDYAYVIDGDINKNNPTGSRERGDAFGHIALGYIW
ncbi:uncharacterized protein NMK_0292 [Novimethylophilus kurashikiensis]|uniref:POTRA domain-containing protein n=1 Tax=Novimethylophilus kurashikiensis TaxID=1825523 RepID=A0A2R5F3Y2_9PROT|nr:ShlB/FhaC/HecB family hemolysin secretion/activation protein [Novimethylophilus kurashikiensis]GBG12759.1 uncharacterized protein NMK_0292 [Novimethylophilus kurashikiensis]